MRIAVTGASGLVGSALTAELSAAGHRVDRLVRRAPLAGRGEIYWNVASGEIDAASLEGIDGVVHLAGANIGARRWTARRKILLRESRVEGTRLLAGAIASLERKPRFLLSASAIGYYGDRGDETLTEESGPGTGFLASLCRAWEGAAEEAVDAGIRVVSARIGLVLSRRGGALARMLLPFRLGLGGPIGEGRQYMSCIALTDLVRALAHLIDDPDASGPWNLVMPGAVTNAAFARALGDVLRRPAFLPLPGPVVSLLFGEMGRELLLTSTRVRPVRLEEARFRFRFGNVEAALRGELAPGREEPTRCGF